MYEKHIQFIYFNFVKNANQVRILVAIPTKLKDWFDEIRLNIMKLLVKAYKIVSVYDGDDAIRADLPRGIWLISNT